MVAAAFLAVEVLLLPRLLLGLEAGFRDGLEGRLAGFELVLLTLAIDSPVLFSGYSSIERL